MSTVIANTWLNKDGTENYKCRAWVNFDGTTSPPTIRASGNVSSVTRSANGVFTVNFVAPMPDANYSPSVASVDVSGPGYPCPAIKRDVALSTSSITFIMTYQAGSTTTQANAALISVSIFR